MKTCKKINLQFVFHTFQRTMATATTSSSVTSNSDGGRGNWDDYPFLRNCEKETSTPITGTTRGVIPPWLQGELTRVGPGIQQVGKDHYQHIFDGLAILHKFQIQDGTVTYQSKALRSDAYKRNMEANRIVISGFGTVGSPDPCQTLFGKMKADFRKLATKAFKKSETDPDDIRDNCLVNVGYYGDQLYAMTETNHVRRVDPATLDTIGEKTTITDYVAINSATAHPHFLPDGTAINIGSNFRHAKGPHYCFLKVPPSFGQTESSFAKSEIIAEIPVRWKLNGPSYFHSFGVTQTGKLIFIEYPLCLNVIGLVSGLVFRPLAKSYSEWNTWHSKEKTRFYVVSMDNGEIHPVTYETDELFTFHHINAFEEDGELIVDVAGYSDGEWVGHMTVKDTRKPGKMSEKPAARRYVLPLAVDKEASKSKEGENNLLKGKHALSAKAYLRKGKKDVIDLTPHFFTDGMLEMPRINYKYNGTNYRYFYGLGNKKPAVNYEFVWDVITKVDTSTGERVSWEAEDETRASEPIFVPDVTKEDPEEDDGVILTALLPNKEPRKVSLLILNAKDMKEMGRVDFLAEGQVTGTFHGLWAQKDEKLHLY